MAYDHEELISAWGTADVTADDIEELIEAFTEHDRSHLAFVGASNHYGKSYRFAYVAAVLAALQAKVGAK